MTRKATATRSCHLEGVLTNNTKEGQSPYASIPTYTRITLTHYLNGTKIDIFAFGSDLQRKPATEVAPQ